MSDLDTCRKAIEQRIRDKGFEPGEYQAVWRGANFDDKTKGLRWLEKTQETFNSDDCTLAILDALCNQGSIAAWNGDGVSCVMQMLALVYRERDKLKAQLDAGVEDEDWLAEHLRMWKKSGIEAPRNELQSIHAWLVTLGDEGAEKTKEIMRTRMILLMNAVNDLAEKGSEAEVKAGIYDNDLEALRKRAYNEGVEAAAKLVDECFDECEPWLRPEDVRELMLKDGD